MKATELRPLFKEVQKSIPNLSSRNRLMFLCPIGHVLRGMHFDPSAFDRKTLYVDVFVQPFCVPTDHYHLTFGFRLDDAMRWSMAMPDLALKLIEKVQTQALPFLSASSTLEGFVETVRPFMGNPHAAMAAAFSLARMGELRRSIAAIEDYLPKLDRTLQWQSEIAERSAALRHLLVYEPDLAAAELEKWEGETIRALGLEQHR